VECLIACELFLILILQNDPGSTLVQANIVPTKLISSEVILRKQHTPQKEGDRDRFRLRA
jgi:hypothetical protein